MSWYNPRPPLLPKLLPRQLPKVVTPSFIGDRGLVVLFLFETGSLRVLHDYSGLGNHGRFAIDIPTWEDGPHGWGLRFSPRINVPDVPSFSIDTNISFGMWLRTRVTTNQQLFHKPSNVWGLEVFNSLFRGVVDVSGAKTVDSSTSVVANRWYHLYCVYDGSNLKLYLDGVNEANTAVTGTITTNTNEVRIGESLQGSIAYLSIYNRALTAAEVKNAFQSSKDRFV